MIRLLLIALVVALAGCAESDATPKANITDLHTMEGFRMPYPAQATVIYRVGIPEGNRVRLCYVSNGPSAGVWCEP